MGLQGLPCITPFQCCTAWNSCFCDLLWSRWRRAIIGFNVFPGITSFWWIDLNRFSSALHPLLSRSKLLTFKGGISPTGLLAWASVEAPRPAPFAGALGLGFDCADCFVGRGLDWRLLFVAGLIIGLPIFISPISPLAILSYFPIPRAFVLYTQRSLVVLAPLCRYSEI